jgi:hypothetical protein
MGDADQELGQWILVIGPAPLKEEPEEDGENVETEQRIDQKDGRSGPVIRIHV